MGNKNRVKKLEERIKQKNKIQEMAKPILKVRFVKGDKPYSPPILGGISRLSEK